MHLEEKTVPEEPEGQISLARLLLLLFEFLHGRDIRDVAQQSLPGEHEHYLRQLLLVADNHVVLLIVIILVHKLLNQLLNERCFLICAFLSHFLGLLFTFIDAVVRVICRTARLNVVKSKSNSNYVEL